MGRFGEYHPTVIFIYFIAVVSFSMLVLHPVMLCISMAFSILYSVLLNGKKAILFNIIYMLPTALIAILINAFTNKNGTNIIFTISENIEISLEAVLFGTASAFMIICVISWFLCFNKIMTTDKIMYITGRRLPSFSLVLSMVFRFIPRFKSQLKKTVNAQRCIGNDISAGNFFDRIKCMIKITSVMTTWALENSIETADSMKCRGYGLPLRSSFSIYRFKRNDLIVFIYTIFSVIFLLIGILNKNIYCIYYPVAKMNFNTPSAILIYVVYGLLCSLPIITDVLEDIKWKYLKSTI